MQLLIVEDDPDIGTVLTEALHMAGHLAHLCTNGETALERAVDPALSAIVLDVMLPGFSGFEICQRLREQGVTTPILMLTCRDQETDMLRGFRLGADDYMSKPFSTAELLARLEALHRRSGTYAIQNTQQIGPLTIDALARTATCNAQALDLSHREFELLSFLVKNRQRAVSRDELLDQVWSDNGSHTTNVVDVYIGYLRKKLSVNGAKGCLRTIRGFGFQFTPEAAQ